MFKVAWSPVYCHPLPEGHRFPMEKYTLLKDQLLHEGVLQEENFFTPGRAKLQDVHLVHHKEYVQKLETLSLTASEIRKTGFPLTRQLVERELCIMQGTLDCVSYALQYGASFNIAGGTHHAFSNRGEGFCLLNDQAIAAAWLLNKKLVKKVLIVDLDVHQGNGTAEIFNENTNVFTFSMHGAKNYPMFKESSSLDVPLADGIEDKEYLQKLEESLALILKHIKPEFVFYQCGVDVLATDKLGRLGLTPQGCKERDFKVIKFARTLNVPLVASMGGGYSYNIKHILDAHCNTFKVVKEVYF